MNAPTTPEPETPVSSLFPLVTLTPEDAKPGNSTLRLLRRMVILVTGVIVLLVGVAMLVLPGPAVIVIPAGLAILATEFLWARRILNRMKDFVKRSRQQT